MAPSNRGWIKLNSDGAISLNGQRMVIGGVIRNSEGRWLWSYSMNLGNEFIFKIEARATLEGLKIFFFFMNRFFKSFNIFYFTLTIMYYFINN